MRPRNGFNARSFCFDNILILITSRLLQSAAFSNSCGACDRHEAGTYLLRVVVAVASGDTPFNTAPPGAARAVRS